MKPASKNRGGEVPKEELNLIFMQILSVCSNYAVTAVSVHQTDGFSEHSGLPDTNPHSYSI